MYLKTNISRPAKDSDLSGAGGTNISRRGARRDQL
jgi:hypothetical protein